MKRTLISLCLAAASLAPVLATADSSAQLQVTGTIKPEACNISSSLTLVDLGEIPFSKLKPSAKTRLDKSYQFTLTLTCSEKTLVGFRPIDNRAGTASYLGWHAVSYKWLFGLGSVAGVPLGSYRYFIYANPVADGAKVSIGTYDEETGHSWPSFTEVEVNKVHILMKDWDNTTPLSFKSATLVIQPAAYVGNSDLLPKGRRLKLDGSTTFELVYL
ncbi:DUF1120 domain-containing protein [Bordetella sp. 15P40C-2]|uniref:DUF1120 domain-containing protein n=1 Tax=Bordetella sp. 15P40C-2 TaxID=2572246 RepID=UPI00132918B0|nr:DUF1120 domain-containing protein [Bordetella sp. 15P40C-2]MVW73631.1 DUF1120 domain-containing protein [Bordetella sp. 15P40C-2]